LAGDLTQLTYPDGETIKYTPDSAGRMLSAVDSGNSINYVTGATYGPDSGLTGFVSGNTGSFAGITNAFSYNKRLQPINMSATAPGQTVFSIGYDFHVGNGTSGSDNGNVWGITNYKDNSRNQSFTYDALNRLISAQNAGTDCTKSTVNGKTEYWGNSYGYDAWGNLLAKTVTKCSAENLSVTALTNNQLTGYGYDAAGNMISDPTDGVTLTYDAESQMATATKSSVTTTYSYDADGNRSRKVLPGSPTTEYVYFNGRVIAEKNTVTGTWTNYVFFNGERVARRDPGNAVSYYFSDHLKTASVITDSVGNIKSESDYYPWGGELQFTNNDSNHYKFTGKERDTETGLDYFGARYYSNGLGRWISPDWSAGPVPVPYANFSDPQTLNQYSYVRNLPTTKIDRDGHGIWNAIKCTFGSADACAAQADEKAKKEQQEKEAQHRRAEDARKTLSGMKGFTLNGMTPRDFANSANDQQALAGLNAATNFVFAEAQKNFFCGPDVSCGIAFPVGGMGAAAEEGAFSEYVNVTRGASVNNIKTNVTASEFGANLEANGFTKSTSGSATIYTKGNTQYTIYPVSRSTLGPTAQVKINGEVVGKIRLQ
jgi:RHS repeat-associated protein